MRLLVAIVFVALTASFNVLLMRAALGAALRTAARVGVRTRARTRAGALVARLLAAAGRRILLAATAFLIRVHFVSFNKVKKSARRNRMVRGGIRYRSLAD